MRTIINWAAKHEVHQDVNCFMLTILCQKVEQDWILDTHQRGAFTIENLIDSFSEVSTLQGKPKLTIIETYRGSKYKYLEH